MCLSSEITGHATYLTNEYPSITLSVDVRSLLHQAMPSLCQKRSKQRNGLSPFTAKKDRAGKRKRFELHHIKPVGKGGAVYDINNIRVLTPKRHIELHAKKEG